MSGPDDLHVLRVLQKIQKDIAAVRVNTSQLPEMARDIQELVSRTGRALELEERIRRIEEHLQLVQP